MLWLRKSKKGFTLIELMVVVAIIGVLALLGLRVYSGQQEKAKNAIIKANAGTIQTLIQADLADKPESTIIATGYLDTLVGSAGIYNPVTGSKQTSANYSTGTVEPTVAAGTDGEVYVYYRSDTKVFYINGNDAASGTGRVYDTYLTARR